MMTSCALVLPLLFGSVGVGNHNSHDKSKNTFSITLLLQRSDLICFSLHLAWLGSPAPSVYISMCLLIRWWMTTELLLKLGWNEVLSIMSNHRHQQKTSSAQVTIIVKLYGLATWNGSLDIGLNSTTNNEKWTLNKLKTRRLVCCCLL